MTMGRNCTRLTPQAHTLPGRPVRLARTWSALSSQMMFCLCSPMHAHCALTWAWGNLRLQVNAKTFLEKRYSDDLELEDAIHTALLTLKEGFEGQISGSNIEVAIVGEDQKFRVLTPSEVSDYLEEVE